MNTWSTSIHSATQLLNVFLIISGRKQKIHLQCSAGLWCGAVVWCRMFLTCLAPECVRWPWDMVIIIILVNTHYCSLHLIFFTPECLQPFSHILDTHQSTCSHIFSSSPHLLLWQHQLVLLVMTGLFLWFDLNIKKGQLPSNLYDLSWNLMCWLHAVMELQSHRTTSLQMSMLLFRRDTLLLPTLERERSLILGLWSCPCWSLWVSFVNNIVCRDSNSECCLQRLFLYLQLCFFSFQTTSTSQQSEDHSRVMDPWRSLTRSEMLLRLFLKIRTSWPSMIEMKHQQWPLTRDKFCMWYSQLTSNGGHQSIVWTLLFIFE